MIVLSEHDLKVVSEGKQVETYIKTRYGKNGISLIAEKMGLEKTTLIRYLQSYRLEKIPATTSLMLKLTLGKDFSYKTIDDQIDELVNTIDRDLTVYKGNLKIIIALEKLFEKAASPVTKAKCKMVIATISSTPPLELIKMLEDIAKESNSRDECKIKSFAYKAIAYIYYEQRNSSKCIECAKYALKYESDEIEKSRLHHTIALSYISSYDYKNAVNELYKALEAHEENDEGKMKIYNVIGVAEFNAGNIDEATKMFSRVESLANKLEDLDYLLISYNNLFDVWFDNSEIAKKYMNEALDLAKENGYEQSKLISKVNYYRYMARYENDESMFVKYVNSIFKNRDMDTWAMAFNTRLLVKDIMKMGNGILYANLAINSIMDMINDCSDELEASKFKQVVGDLINLLSRGESNEKKIINIRFD